MMDYECQSMLQIKLSQKQLNLFEEIGVSIVYLFGSSARGLATLHSDIDLGIVFAQPGKYASNTLDIYSKLYNSLVEALPKDYLKRRFENREHELDIVFLQFTPVSFQFEAATQGMVIYEKSTRAKFDYLE